VFDYGAGGSLGNRVTTTSAGSQETDTVIATVDGLAPATPYSFRAAGFDGTHAIAPTATGQFTTDGVNGPGAAGPTGPAGDPGLPGPRGDQGEPAVKLLVAVVKPKLGGRSGKRVVVDYLSTGAAAVTLEVRKGRKTVARVSGRARVGRNRIAWSGKQGRREAKPGKYTLHLAVTGGDGQTASDRGAVTLRR
jgi:hypothetical protein